MYNTVDELADHVITAFEDSSKHALSEFLNILIAFGGLIGVNLNAYNGIAGMSPQQAIVDEAIIRINAFIKDLNARNHVIHPRLTSKIHWWKKGRCHNQYHLLYDGLHLGPVVIQNWVKNIKRFHSLSTVQYIKYEDADKHD